MEKAKLWDNQTEISYSFQILSDNNAKQIIGKLETRRNRSWSTSALTEEELVLTRMSFVWVNFLLLAWFFLAFLVFCFIFLFMLALSGFLSFYSVCCFS